MPSVAAFAIVVADMGRSVAFYRALGLPVPDGADSAPHAEIDLGGGIRFLIDTQSTIRSFDRSWITPTGSARAGLALECTDPAEVDSTYASMVERGFAGHLAPWDAFWGQRYATLHDPDGNTVDLFAPLPLSPTTDPAGAHDE